MKKLLTILILLLAVVTQGYADGTILWEGTQAISWSDEFNPKSDNNSNSGNFVMPDFVFD